MLGRKHVVVYQENLGPGSYNPDRKKPTQIPKSFGYRDTGMTMEDYRNLLKKDREEFRHES